MSPRRTEKRSAFRRMNNMDLTHRPPVGASSTTSPIHLVDRLTRRLCGCLAYGGRRGKATFPPFGQLFKIIQLTYRCLELSTSINTLYV